MQVLSLLATYMLNHPTECRCAPVAVPLCRQLPQLARRPAAGKFIDARHVNEAVAQRGVQLRHVAAQKRVIGVHRAARQIWLHTGILVGRACRQQHAERLLLIYFAAQQTREQRQLVTARGRLHTVAALGN